MRWIPVISCFVALATAAPAFGSDVAVTMRLGPGGLSLQARNVRVADHPVLIPLTVTDARGTGAGWLLSLASSELLSVTSITARCAPGSTCTLPETFTTPNGRTLLQALPNSGMGVIDLDVTVAARGESETSFPVVFSVGAR